jgi:L-ornithine N5-oxygenase
MRPDNQQIHDFLLVGFGPAGLAVAVAAYEKRNLSFVALEQQDDFKWHPGMLIPGASMQISFIKDLATLRDPKSEFTFLNYLFEQGRLVKFLNLDTFLPQREEYQDYMNWAAKKIAATGCVKYNTRVRALEQTEDAQVLKISAIQTADGADTEKIYFARNVIICTGGQPWLPEEFPQDSSRLLHSSQFIKQLPSIQQSLSKNANSRPKHGFCVIGAGQSAAEIWNHLTKTFPEDLVDLKFRSGALKPSDDSPFVNEIFDPAVRIDKWYGMPEEARKSLIQESKATNYSVVRLHLLEEMYKHLYLQHLPGHHQVHRISPNTLIENIQIVGDGDNAHVEISTKDSLIDSTRVDKFDYVFAATGYQRNFHKQILRNFDDVTWTEDADRPAVDRQYRVVRTKEHSAGIYLQGLCEASHGLSDTLLSVLATRGMEVVEDISKRIKPSKSSQKAIPGDLNGSLGGLTDSDYGSDSAPTPDSTSLRGSDACPMCS